MDKKKPITIVSLFSGCGGMDIGVKNADFDILAEIEIDKYCCQTLRAAAEREKKKKGAKFLIYLFESLV